MPSLVSFSGLPGVGKTTIARSLANETGALWLWLDEIEAAMRASHMQVSDLADGGYAAAQAVALGALRQGYDVIADCVNPLPLTRNSWQQVALDAQARFLGVELICSDRSQHRFRVENRSVNLPGWVRPGWSDVIERDYLPYTEAVLRIDTALTSVDQSVARICAAMRHETGESIDV